MNGFGAERRLRESIQEALDHHLAGWKFSADMRQRVLERIAAAERIPSDSAPMDAGMEGYPVKARIRHVPASVRRQGWAIAGLAASVLLALTVYQGGQSRMPGAAVESGADARIAGSPATSLAVSTLSSGAPASGDRALPSDAPDTPVSADPADSVGVRMADVPQDADAAVAARPPAEPAWYPAEEPASDLPGEGGGAAPAEPGTERAVFWGYQVDADGVISVIGAADRLPQDASVLAVSVYAGGELVLRQQADVRGVTGAGGVVMMRLPELAAPVSRLTEGSPVTLVVECAAQAADGSPTGFRTLANLVVMVPGHAPPGRGALPPGDAAPEIRAVPPVPPRQP